MTEPRPSTIKEGAPELYPVLPLRDIVVFPYMIVPLFVGREKSIAALEEVMRSDKQILLVAQKNASDDEPSTDGIYAMGTLASVLQLLKLPDGTVKVLVEGTRRAAIRRYTDNENYFEAEVERVEETVGSEDEIEALARSVVSQFESYVKLNKKISPEVLGTASQIEDYSKLADTIATPSRHQDRREAADPRGHFGLRAAGARLHADGERDLGAPGRAQDQKPRQAPDGEDAARVLSERADEGDSEGARRQRGRPRRPGRDRAEDREDQAVQGSPREGDRRAQEAPPDEPDVGRGDRGPQLSRLAAHHPVGRQGQDQARPRRGAEDPRRGSLRAGEGQGSHRRISGGAEPHQHSSRARSSAWSARPASARPRSASPWPTPRGASSCA